MAASSSSKNTFNNISKDLQAYEELKTIGWLIGIGVLFLLHFVPLFFKNRRAVASLAIELEQLILLAVFKRGSFGELGTKALFSTQFVYFKILDKTLKPPSISSINVPGGYQAKPNLNIAISLESVFGFFNSFLANSIYLVGIGGVLLLLKLATCCWKTGNNFFTQLFVRFFGILFITPLAIYAAMTPKKELAYMLPTTIVFASLAILSMVFYYLKRSQNFDDDDDAEDTVNILEFKNALSYKRKVAWFWNIAFMPLFKIIVALFYAVKIDHKKFSNQSSATVIGFLFLIFIFLIILVRPYNKTVHNIFAALMTLLAALISIIALSQSTLEPKKAEKVGFVVVVLFGIFLVYYLVTMIVNPAKHVKEVTILIGATQAPNGQQGTAMMSEHSARTIPNSEGGLNPSNASQGKPNSLLAPPNNGPNGRPGGSQRSLVSNGSGKPGQVMPMRPPGSRNPSNFSNAGPPQGRNPSIRPMNSPGNGMPMNRPPPGNSQNMGPPNRAPMPSRSQVGPPPQRNNFGPPGQRPPPMRSQNPQRMGPPSQPSRIQYG